MLSRREFLGYGAAGVSFVSLAGGLPRLLARAAEESAVAAANDHVLVVVELSGGNDGLNTVIPFENPLYYSNRPTLAIAKEEVLRLSHELGLHPAMPAFSELFQEGRLAVVQGVGYPEPDRSHFRSMEIWHTASTDREVPTTGWLGRVLDEKVAQGVADPEKLPGLSLTYSLPQAFLADQVVVPVVAQLDNLATEDEGSPRDKVVRQLSTAPGAAAGPVDFMRRQAQAVYRAADQLREATARYQSTVEYPGTGLGEQLQRAAQIVAADLGVRVLYVTQDGYDTHAGQADDHAGLLNDLSTSLLAFQRDLEQLQRADHVVTMVISEFGRRVDENGSQGTDHGAASNVFVLGTPVLGGLYGQHPSLEQLGDGDLIYNTDFRSVYAKLLDGWLGCPSAKLLGEKFAPVELLQATA
jgi:uncharacterized protein (DUF1501 family)